MRFEPNTLQKIGVAITKNTNGAVQTAPPPINLFTKSILKRESLKTYSHSTDPQVPKQHGSLTRVSKQRDITSRYGAIAIGKITRKGSDAPNIRVITSLRPAELIHSHSPRRNAGIGTLDN